MVRHRLLLHWRDSTVPRACVYATAERSSAVSRRPDHTLLRAGRFDLESQRRDTASVDLRRKTCSRGREDRKVVTGFRAEISSLRQQGPENDPPFSTSQRRPSLHLFNTEWAPPTLARSSKLRWKRGRRGLTQGTMDVSPSSGRSSWTREPSTAPFRNNLKASPSCFARLPSRPRLGKPVFVPVSESARRQDIFDS